MLQLLFHDVPFRGQARGGPGEDSEEDVQDADKREECDIGDI